MKKFIIGVVATVTFVALLIGAGYLVVMVVDKSNERLSTAEEKEQRATLGTSYDSLEEEIAAQTGFVGGINQTIDPKDVVTFEQIGKVMHKMTHQKVSAEEKWGAIPMTEENVAIVKEAALQTSHPDINDIHEILDRWAAEDFSRVDKDHNYFWRMQNGNIGKAYGIMSAENEQAFIENNFGQYSE